MIKTGLEVECGEWFKIEAMEEVRVSGARYHSVLNVTGPEMGLTALMS